MLNKEEKKAIRNLENLSEYGLSTTLNQADLDKMKIILNLITKQSNILNKIEEYAKGMNDKELLLILKSNEIDELINKCNEGEFFNE